jgi:ABC-type lipoprotein release transport system permease subunit
VLVGSGIYATLSQLVADRRREMDVRVALGATQPLVLRLVLFDGLRPALLGLATGLAGAAAFGRLLAAAVAGTPAFDARLFVLLPVALLALTAMACAVPAWRATRVDPTIALRDA